MEFCRFPRSVKFVVRSLGRFLGRGVCLEASPVTYHLVEQRMKRGRVMLVDKVGFSYNINSRRPYVTY